MAKNGFKAMDSDMHVFEPADLWQRYIDKKYLDRAPKGLNRSFRDLGIELEGKIMPIPAQAGKSRAGEIPARLLRRKIWRSRQDETSTASRKSKPWTKKASMWRFSFRPVG